MKRTVKNSFRIHQQQQAIATQTWGKEGAFADKEISTILTDAEHLPPQDGKINAIKGTKDKGYRSSTLKWLPLEFGWVYDRMLSLATKANNEKWQYDITGADDPIQLTEYYATEEGHYDWHIDVGDGPTSSRKISVCVQLNDDYEGGEFEILTSKTPRQMPKKAGFVSIFPGWMLHRVRPVTKGIRRSLVLWVCGPPLR